MQLIISLILALCLSSFVCIQADVYAEGAWRKSIDGDGACWTDRSCQRVLTTAHGGEWNISFPYDSMPAFNQAYLDGADAIKGGKNTQRQLFFSVKKRYAELNDLLTNSSHFILLLLFSIA